MDQSTWCWQTRRINSATSTGRSIQGWTLKPRSLSLNHLTLSRSSWDAISSSNANSNRKSLPKMSPRISERRRYLDLKSTLTTPSSNRNSLWFQTTQRREPIYTSPISGTLLPWRWRLSATVMCHMVVLEVFRFHFNFYTSEPFN